MKDRYSVQGKVVLVTGGTGLLGWTYCEAFAAAGAAVVVADLSERRPEERAEELCRRSGTAALGVACDVGQESQVVELVRRATERFGRLDVAVNNAAVTAESMKDRAEYFSPFEGYPLKAWEAALQTNLTGAFLVCREVGKVMKRGEGGSIINVASIYGLVGPRHEIYEGLSFRSVASYSASKAGLLGLTRWLASYWARDGIRVNAVTPGGVYNQQDPEFVRRYAAHAPIGRMADKSEVVGVVLFLASEASSYCTGQNFVVDGGWTAW